jgi:hypothetical protein
MTVSSSQELSLAVEDALRFSRSGRAIVEEYMDGPEFSIDAIVYDGEVTMCGLADRHIFFPPYFIEMGHTMPTNIDAEKQDAILKVFTQGVKVLGITNGAAKGDMKLTSRGPMIGEIAARLSGGYMSGWTYPYSSGVEPAHGAIMVAMGKKPDQLSPLKNWTSAERAFISIPGMVKSIHGIDEAEKMPHIKNVFLRSKAGSSVKFPENNVSKCGNIISAAPNREEAICSAEDAARSILIHLEAPNEETEKFLRTWTAFPPNAFPVDENTIKLLNDIPEGKCIPSKSRKLMVHPFPEFTQRKPLDYMGRTIPQTFEAISTLTGYTLDFSRDFSQNADLYNEAFLGREFWRSLIRGGYQAAVYYIDLIDTQR